MTAVEHATGGSVLGTGQRRLEGGRKVTGALQYTADLRVDRLTHARLVLSTHAAARITRIDTAAAARVPGVLAVATAGELGDLLAAGLQVPLAKDRVGFVGEPVAAVIAGTEEAAADGAAVVEIDYEPMAGVIDPELALEPGAPVVRSSAADADDAGAHGTAAGGAEQPQAPNQRASVNLRSGDPEGELRACAQVVSRRYWLPAVQHSCLEPHVAMARWEPEGEVTVWTPTQGQFVTRRGTAAALGLTESQVRIVAMPVGGGFGGKVSLLEPLVALLAKLVRRPVRLELTRTEEFLMGRGGPACRVDLTLGADASGQLRALIADMLFDCGAGDDRVVRMAAAMLAGTYRIPAYRITGHNVATNKTPVTAYRAPGAPHAYFALESAVGELAARLGADPIELRLRHASREGDVRPDGSTWPRIGLVECLEAARRHPLYAAARAGGEGVGVAVGGWGGGRESAAAGCRVEPDGTITVQLGHQDISGTDTTMAMIAAETMGVPLDRVRIEKGDSATSPHAGMAGGSKITYTVGPAVQQAVVEARRQLLEIAAEELEVAPEDLEVEGGEVFVRGVPTRRRGIGQLAGLAVRFGSSYAPVQGQGRTAIRDQAPMFTVHVARVRVDAEVGTWSVSGYAAIQDVGRSLNPPEVEGQIHGGVLQCLGRALGEELVYDGEGQLLTASFLDYGIPSIDQAPLTEVELVEVPSTAGPFGAKGVGEPPAIPGAAAIANAIEDACGVRLTSMPFRRIVPGDRAMGSA
ncbi:MAG TPA: xanthine dehydrogenase family protein molybdopterin-binding subunit [Candidatus Dormibacteraeota bacterium]|jgi:CO/xanthine dehydrogenase Mo-binding subunit|nr:xanthine dehydrogenase family protein molybdopterin-binding subunit [Candidatus Dormibacteraeota bacterium]